MHTFIDALRAEHRQFEHVLALVAGTCRLGNVSDPDACRFMANAVRYLQEFSDTFHNEKDSVLLRKLLVADPGCLDLCQGLSGLRRELRQVEQALQEHIAVAHGGDVEACQKVKALAETYRGLYSDYIAREEQEAMPAAQMALSELDWREIAGMFPKVPDPVFSNAALRAHGTPYDALLALSKPGSAALH